MQMHVVHGSPGTERGQPDDGWLIAESWRVPERFGVVFDRHAAAIHGYIARRLGRDAADDLVGETFLVAFGRRGGYDPDQPSARPWLYGIATRLVSRRRRDEVRFFRAIARTGIDPAADPAAEPVADQGARRADAQMLHRRPARAGGAAGGGPGCAAAGRRRALTHRSGAGAGACRRERCRPGWPGHAANSAPNSAT
jgi:Sigma-70 region 2